jgi:hypothetical protein
LISSNEQLIVSFTEFLDEKEAILDRYIDSGSDHDLFIASYIHGHFSVIAANLMHAIHAPQNKSASHTQWQLQTRHMLSQSIDDAIANNELAGTDAQDVVNMRNMLFVDILE